jgi:CTD small phosphatase-like protein 2
VLKLLDPHNSYISHKVYRSKCIYKGGQYLKDLRIFANRDMRRMVIVDNSIVSFAKQLGNGIYVPSYFGQAEDTILKSVKELLKEIAKCENLAKELEKRLGLSTLYNNYICSLN